MTDAATSEQGALARLQTIVRMCPDLNVADPTEQRHKINKCIDELMLEFDSDDEEAWYLEVDTARKASNDDVLAHLRKARKYLKRGAPVPAISPGPQTPQVSAASSASSAARPKQTMQLEDDGEEVEKKGKKRVEKKEQQLHPWVRKGAYRPTPKDLQAMKDALTDLKTSYGDDSRIKWKTICSDAPPIPVFVHEQEGTMCFLRHYLLCLAIHHGVNSKWEDNLDRVDSRQMRNLHKNVQLQKKLGLVRLNLDTFLAKIDAYLPPDTPSKNIGRAMILLVRLDGALEGGGVRIANDRVLPVDEYNELLLQECMYVEHVQQGSEDEEVSEDPDRTIGDLVAAAGKKKADKKTVKRGSKTLLRLLKGDISLGPDQVMLKAMVTYTGKALMPPGVAEWMNDALDVQDKVDTKLVCTLDNAVGTKHQAFAYNGVYNPHRPCSGDVECKYRIEAPGMWRKQNDPCRHKYCNPDTCREEAVIMMNMWSAFELASPVHSLTGERKSPEATHMDKTRVHKHSETTKVSTIKQYLSNVREFVE